MEHCWISVTPATTFSTKLSRMGDKLIVFTNCFQPPPLQSYRLLTCFIKAALLWEISWGAWETSCDYTASLIPQPLSVSVYNLIGWCDGKISLHGLNFLFSVRICHAWLGALSWRLAFCLTSFAKESLLTVTQDWCTSKTHILPELICYCTETLTREWCLSVLSCTFFSFIAVLCLKLKAFVLRFSIQKMAL